MALGIKPDVWDVLSLWLWQAFLEALLPEHYAEPAASPEPTSTLPGTHERRLALRDRVTAGVQLWHDRDANFDDDEHVGRLLHKCKNGRNSSVAGPVQRLPHAAELPGNDYKSMRPSERRTVPCYRPTRQPREDSTLDIPTGGD